MNFVWLPAARPLPPRVQQALFDELRGRSHKPDLSAFADAYCAGASELLRRWPTMRGRGSSVGELNASITKLRKAVVALTPLLEHEAFPYIVRETLLTRDHVADPHAFIADLQERLYLVGDAAGVTLGELPGPKRGKRADTSRMALESALRELFAKVTGKRATSVRAAACARIVLEMVGQNPGSADSLQRGHSKRRTRAQT